MNCKGIICYFILFSFVRMVSIAQPMDPVLANKLQKKVDSIRLTSNYKGISVSIIHPALGTWKGVSGISHAGTPITSDMLFGIASNTKLFTSVLVLKLVENNLIRLEDALHQYLPGFKNMDPNITIRQLLNHTSGLADVSSIQGYPDSILTNPNRIYTATELMNWLGTPHFAPGTDWNYCNTNYLLAGMIIEKVTGKSYTQFLRDSLLTPLQLDSTFLDVYETIPFSVAHPWQGGIDNNSVPRISLNSAAWSAGAMYSTSSEMIQWYQALMNGKVINSNSIKEMTTFVGSGNYGMGIAKTIVSGRPVWTHGGQIWGGYNSSMMYDPSTGIIICVLINQLPAQAFQVSAQLLSTLISFPVIVENKTKESMDIGISPNPATQRLFINNLNREVRYSVINLAGEAVDVGLTANSINLDRLSSGIYFVKLESLTFCKTFKFFKD